MAEPYRVVERQEFGHPVFRLTLPGGLYYDNTPEKMWVALRGGMLKELTNAMDLIHERGWKLAPVAWTGPRGPYPVFSISGASLGSLRLPWGLEERRQFAQCAGAKFIVQKSAYKPAADTPRYLSALALRAAGKALTLLSTTWEGRHAKYKFSRPDGHVLYLTSAELKTYRSSVDRFKAIAAHGAKIEPGYELVMKGPGDLAQDEKGQYTWWTPAKELIKATLAELERKSTSIFISAPELPLKTAPLKTQFRWTLPDGSTIEATWPEFDAVLAKILGKSSRHSFIETGFSTRVHRELSARRHEFRTPGRSGIPKGFLPLRFLEQARQSKLQRPSGAGNGVLPPYQLASVLGESKFDSIQAVEAKIRELEGLRDSMREQATLASKRAALDEIVAMMTEHHLTVTDLDQPTVGKRGRDSAKVSLPVKGKLPPKYRNPDTGETWSGHARPPRWIKNVKDRSRFLVTPEAVDGVKPAALHTIEARKDKTHNKKTVAPKYRDPQSGATWSGRGLAPLWIRDAEDRTPFLIK
jgi:DNA-binding protein H-NS